MSTEEVHMYSRQSEHCLPFPSSVCHKQTKHGVFTQKIYIFLYRKALWGRHVSENAHVVDHVQLTISEEQRANFWVS